MIWKSEESWVSMKYTTHLHVWHDAFFFTTAVRGSVLQCVAACCSVLQCVAVCCSALQCSVHTCTITLKTLSFMLGTVRSDGNEDTVCQISRTTRRRATADCSETTGVVIGNWNTSPGFELLQWDAVCWIVLHCVAVCCSVLQCVGTWKLVYAS